MAEMRSDLDMFPASTQHHIDHQCYRKLPNTLIFLGLRPWRNWQTRRI